MIIREFLSLCCVLEKRKRDDGRVYQSYYEIIKELGVSFPIELIDISLRGIRGYCFSNSQKLMNYHESFYYVEGLAIAQGLDVPLDHAWLYDDSSQRFIETTWREPGSEYLGVIMKPLWVKKRVEKRDDPSNVAILSGNYKERGDLLRGFPPEGLFKVR